MKAALLGALCVLCVTAQHPAVSDTIFAAGEGPKCWLHNGKTIVHYTSTMHDSFHCSHNTGSCACVWNHPTHHKGLCKSVTHTDGKTHTIGGACDDSGLNDCTAAEITCQNGGAPNGQLGSCGCTCADGFEGDHCETNTDDCVDVTCQNGGSCVDGVNSYSCSCDTHYTGSHCENDERPQWTDYSNWGTCTKTCGTGSKTRIRNCVAHDASTAAPPAPGPVARADYDQTFSNTWCVDHYARVRYDSNGDIFLGGVQPDGSHHSSRGDCGSTAQGWWKIDTIDPTYGNAKIDVKIIGGDHCGTSNGCGMSHQFAPSIATSWDMSNCVMGCGGAQKPTIQVRVRASDTASNLSSRRRLAGLTCTSASPRSGGSDDASQVTSCNTGACKYDQTFSNTWCVDHYARVKFEAGDRSVHLGGVEPSGNLHTGRGDCGGHSQGWWRITEFGAGFSNAKITVNIIGGDHCGTSNGCGMTHQFTPYQSTSWDMSNCVFGCGGAQKPKIRVRVEAW